MKTFSTFPLSLKKYQISLFLGLMLFLSAFTYHKFYVSLSQTEFNPETRRLEIASKVFTDDMLHSVELAINDSLYYGTDKQHPRADELIHEYFENQFSIITDDSAAVTMNVLGFEYDVKVTWVYIESDSIPLKTKHFDLYNSTFFNLLPEQQNYIHFKHKRSKDSYIITNVNPFARIQLDE